MAEVGAKLRPGWLDRSDQALLMAPFLLDLGLSRQCDRALNSLLPAGLEKLSSLLLHQPTTPLQEPSFLK